MGVGAFVGNDLLVDIIAGLIAQKAEIDILPKGREVGDSVRHHPAKQRHECEQSDELKRVSPVARIVQQHPHMETLLRGLAQCAHAGEFLFRVRWGARRGLGVWSWLFAMK